MGYGKITAKQQEILDYIKDEILKRGYPPTVREICETVNLKSTSSVHSHLETLEKNGYIRRDPTKPRAIEICDDSFQMVRTEMVSLPVIGNVAAGQPILAEENIQDYFPVPADVSIISYPYISFSASNLSRSIVILPDISDLSTAIFCPPYIDSRYISLSIIYIGYLYMSIFIFQSNH
jgi:SOS regulatory protein LexA